MAMGRRIFQPPKRQGRALGNVRHIGQFLTRIGLSRCRTHVSSLSTAMLRDIGLDPSRYKPDWRDRRFR